MKRTAVTLVLLFAFSTIYAGVNCIAVGKAEVVGAETAQSTSILVTTLTLT